jgi:hypothetical protein
MQIYPNIVFFNFNLFITIILILILFPDFQLIDQLIIY